MDIIFSLFGISIFGLVAICGFLLDETGIVGIIGILGAAACGIYFYVETKSVDKWMAEQKHKAVLISFYSECIKNGVRSCSNEKDIQKATLIAQKMNLSYTDITALFAESKAMQDKIKQEKVDAAKEEKKTKERQEYDRLTRYAGYSGREKRIAMLSDERKKYLEAANALSSGAAALLSASQFREKDGDWAIMGGVASALAGPAAGMAAALDAQARTAQENAQIRAQNRRNLEPFAPVLGTTLSAIGQKEETAKQLAQEIEATKLKLLAQDPPSACFERLSFDTTKVSVSKTGTCTVKTIVEITPFTIFDDVPAVIDGTIIANIYDGDELVGTAQMVLPIYGLKTVAKLTGMVLFCGRVGRSYTVKFDTENLWAMEE